ncbi:MAG TPA: oxidative damage protection protein [Vicinamibacteria bacterium]|jgi:Fe-S cluster biosynthesis and repair protein YggX
MGDRTVNCVKLGQELPGLPAPPFPGELGQRIYESVSARAWALWQERSAALLRERGWVMGRPEDRQALLREMESFLFTPAPPVPVEGDLVLCVKLGRALPRLAKPPFAGALGQRIFESVSRAGWDLWQAQATIVMNHHGLNMADPEARRFLLREMEEFFFGEGARLPADWVPPTGQGKGGKGAPGAQRK